MPIITITIDDTHEGYALFGELICRYGRDVVDFDLNGLEPEYVDPDPTPAYGTPRPTMPESTFDTPRPTMPEITFDTPRPTTTPTAADGEGIRDWIRQAVNCPTCNATSGWPCHSKKGQNYPDFIHQARIDTWNRQ